MTGLLIQPREILHPAARPPRHHVGDYVRLVAGFALFVFILLVVGAAS